MAQITDYDSSKQKRNINILKRAWQKFMSYDAFTRSSAVVLGLIAFATPIIISQNQSVQNDASAPLATPPAIYYGVSAQGLPNDMSMVTKFETDSGKQVSIVNFYEQWGSTDNKFTALTMYAIRSHGAIPMITWEPWQGKAIDPSYSLQRIISGSYDRYITQFAQDAKQWNSPFFLRFAEQMNGNSHSWDESINSNLPGQYIKAWQHVHDIFAQVGATNVTWVWSVDAGCGNACLVNLSRFYPGDAYVDWIGMDGFITDKKWQSFAGLFSNPYAQLITLTSTKPIMISEIGVSEKNSDASAKATWITDAYSVQLPNDFPGIKAVVWYNFDNSGQEKTNWQIESSQMSQEAFAKAVAGQYYMNNAFSDIVQSPIPPVGQFNPPSGQPSFAPSDIAPSSAAK